MEEGGERQKKEEEKGEREGDRKRELSSIHWLTPQMATRVSTEPGQRQEVRNFILVSPK